MVLVKTKTWGETIAVQEMMDDGYVGEAYLNRSRKAITLES